MISVEDEFNTKISSVSQIKAIETLCAIWYHLYNTKNMKNTFGGMLLLVKLQVTFNHPCFSCFLNYTNGTKSSKASQLRLNVK